MRARDAEDDPLHGFQANNEWRTRYLGPGSDVAKVRGTRFNTGEGIAMALEVGASPAGNWSGAHAVGWEFNAPEFESSSGSGPTPWRTMRGGARPIQSTRR